MKKLWMIIFILSLLAFDAAAQLGKTQPVFKDSPKILKKPSQHMITTLPVANSLILEEIHWLNKLIEEKRAELAPLKTLQQPMIKLLEEERQFVIVQQDFPLWQQIQRRVDPIDIPVWNAVKITKDL